MSQEPSPFSTFSLHLTEHRLDLRKGTENVIREDATFLDLAGQGYYSLSRDGPRLSLIGVNHLSCGSLTVSTDDRINFILKVNGDFPPEHFWNIRLRDDVTLLALPFKRAKDIQDAASFLKELQFNFMVAPPAKALVHLAKAIEKAHLVMLLTNLRLPMGTMFHFDSPESLLKDASNARAFALIRQIG